MKKLLIITLLFLGCSTEPEEKGCCHHLYVINFDGSSAYDFNNTCYEDKSIDWCDSQHTDSLNTWTFYNGDENCQEPLCD